MYVKTLLSYIKDSQHALEVFVTLTSLAKTNLFSPWILHLFIVIPNNGGLGALKYFFDQRIIKEPSSETLSSNRTSTYTQLLFTRWQLVQTNYGVADMDTTMVPS